MRSKRPTHKVVIMDSCNLNYKIINIFSFILESLWDAFVFGILRACFEIM